MARRRRNPEVIAGRVNGDGSIAAGDGFMVQRTGVGAYGVSFPANFRLIAATVSLSNGAVNGNAVRSIDNFQPGVSLNVVTASGTPAAQVDLPFTFVAVGVQQ